MDRSSKRIVSPKSVSLTVFFFGGLVVSFSCTKPTEVTPSQSTSSVSQVASSGDLNTPNHTTLNQNASVSPSAPTATPSVTGAAKGAADVVDVALISRGRSIYMSGCIACHHSDPSKPGAVGPDVKGSSRELIEARIMRAEYPPGYQPKRPSRAMAPLPQFKNDIDALAAFLK